MGEIIEFNQDIMYHNEEGYFYEMIVSGIWQNVLISFRYELYAVEIVYTNCAQIEAVIDNK